MTATIGLPGRITLKQGGGGRAMRSLIEQFCGSDSSHRPPACPRRCALARRRSAAKLLSKKAQRIAVNIAKLPGLMRPCATCFEFNVVMLIPRQQILALGNHL